MSLNVLSSRSQPVRWIVWAKEAPCEIGMLRTALPLSAARRRHSRIPDCGNELILDRLPGAD